MTNLERDPLAKSKDHIGYPSYEQIQRFMFEVGFDIQNPDIEPAFPRAEYMKLAARIVDWTRKHYLCTLNPVLRTDDDRNS